MFKSIVEDLKYSFKAGNMITRIIIINVAISLIFILAKTMLGYDPELQSSFVRMLAIPGNFLSLLLKPWTFITHMFIHSGIWHLLWNMLFLYWFGRIVGDLLGDHRILPLFIMGGIVGALAYIFSYQLFQGMGSYALGSSAAVMAIVATAGAIAPDYSMRLILIGDVKLKFIVLFVILIDIIGVAGSSNTGGHIAHLGGAAFGFLYVRQLREGFDLIAPLGRLLTRINNFLAGTISRKSGPELKVNYRSESRKNNLSNPPRKEQVPFQEKLDGILDKIKESGYESLTDEEKEFLFMASKK